jgi:hypothetical protein
MGHLEAQENQKPKESALNLGDSHWSSVVETIRVFTFFPTALFALLADARI